MPVDVYVNMKDDDLKAIFAYLKTIKPIRNAVRAGLPPPAPAPANKPRLGPGARGSRKLRREGRKGRPAPPAS
jgi:hypothetical protein